MQIETLNDGLVIMSSACGTVTSSGARAAVARPDADAIDGYEILGEYYGVAPTAAARADLPRIRAELAARDA